MLFFSEKNEKRKKEIEKSVQKLPKKMAKNGPKIGKNSKFWTILHFSSFFLVVTNFFLVLEGNGKETLSTVCMGRKWEGNFVYSWYGKEMGRKCCVLFIWEGNGKEMLSIISKGRKWEGYNVDFPFGREKGRKLAFSFPFFLGKGNPADPWL